MIRGTTPTHTFIVPFDVSTIDDIRIIYSQNGKVRLKKTMKDCEMSGNKIEVVLSQEDTLKFVHTTVSLQVRVMRSGTVLASKIVNVNCDRCLENEVM